MRILALASLAILLFSSSPSYAGFSADNCGGSVNRVRGDLVFDLNSGQVFYEKNANTSFHPASLSKLMSLIVIFDALRAGEIDYHDRVQLVRQKGQIDNRTSMIRSMSVREAINGVATGSLNNALDGIAQKIGMDTFIRRMNQKADRLGLHNTNFVSTTGWPTPISKSKQRTTLHELATILRYLETEYEDEYKEFDGKPQVYIAGIGRPLTSTNNLLQDAVSRRANPYKGVVGGKTGYTCYSGWHLITLYKDPVNPKERLVVMSVGHSTGAGRDAHVRELLDENTDKFRRFLRKPKPDTTAAASMPNQGVEVIKPPQN